jgi:hypothetical protein
LPFESAIQLFAQRHDAERMRRMQSSKDAERMRKGCSLQRMQKLS